MSTAPVTIIILAWNQWDYTDRCLESLSDHTDLSTVEVIVVDNGSEDGTYEKLERYPWARRIRNKTNLGYVRGNNVGIDASRPGSDIILLNNDIEITQPEWVETLRRSAYKDSNIGIVGCKLSLPEGLLLHVGTGIWPDTCMGQQIGAMEEDLGQYPGDRDVQGIVFACAYIKRSTIDKIGMLSTRYQSYFEDTDYCLTSRQAGLRVVCCGDVKLIHRQHASTTGNKELFQTLYQTSKRSFETAWKKPLQMQYKHKLHWQSIMNFPSGYAMSCREILKSLDALDVEVSYSYVYGPGTPFPLEESAQSGDYLLNIMTNRQSANPKPDLSVVYAQGDVFRNATGRYKIGYTMLEVDGFPKEWVRQANNMDEVWVPSNFNRETFLASGLRVPIKVMPLGVNPDYFHPQSTSFRNTSGDFVFVSNFEWGERKCPELLLKAFNETFRHDEPVVLVCKTTNRDGRVSVSEEIRKLQLSNTGGRIGFLFNCTFPYYQMASLYTSSDCYVTTTRGEGWDMPLMEAMACGLPSIATDWGAHQEFVREEFSYPLQIKGTVPAMARCPYYEGFRWADPDGDHLRYLLRHIYENRAEAKAKGQRAAEHVLENWTWSRSAARIRARIEDIAARESSNSLPTLRR